MIVADATTLIAMTLTDNLHVVKRLVGTVTVGENTDREIQKAVEALDPGCEPPGDDIVDVVYIDISTPTLARWETEAVQIARTNEAKLMLTDDPVVRDELKPIGVSAIGTLGLLYAAYRRGLIEDIEESVRRLDEVGYGLADHCVEMLLESAE